MILVFFEKHATVEANYVLIKAVLFLSFLQTEGHEVDRFPFATISNTLMMLLLLSLILKC